MGLCCLVRRVENRMVDPSRSGIAEMSKTFWPGYRWRVLARRKIDRCTYSPDSPIHISSSTSSELVQLDELVIDDWFHLEQMDNRVWLLLLGNSDERWIIAIQIDAKGKATIPRMEREP